MSVLTSATPSVDQAHADVLAIPSDVLAWLRSAERRLRQSSALVAALPGEPIKALREIREEYRDILESRESLLVRTMQRPVGQLRSGAAARERLEQLVSDLGARAQTVVDVQLAVEALRDQLRAFEKFRGSLPHFTERLLSENRLQAEHIDRLRRPAEVSAAQNRATAAHVRLEELLSAIPSSGTHANSHDIEGADGLSAEELYALWTLYRRRRRLIARTMSGKGYVRRSFATHMRKLLDVWPDGQSDQAPETLVIAQLLERSLQADDAGMSSDQVAWVAALSGEKRHLVTVPNGAEPSAETEVAENTLFVSPIGESYVYIGREDPSAVRVWTGGIRPGADIECLPVSILGGGIDRATADADLLPLFEGVQDGPTTWYTTRRRLRVRVLMPQGDGWIGKVVQPGSVEPIGGNPWSATHADAAAFRLAGTEITLTQADADPVLASRGGVLWEFQGVRAEAARIPVPGFERAIRKVPVSRAKEFSESIRAERELFEVLARRGNPPLLPYGLVPMGNAIAQGTSTAWPVYLMPDALTIQECPPMASWLRSTVPLRMAALRAVARTLKAVHDAGFGLGIVHQDIVAFGIAAIAVDGTARPGAMLVAAPWAARLDECFEAGSLADEGVLFDHLGVRYAPAVVRQGQEVAREQDANAFALTMLDMLSRRPTGGVECVWSAPGDPLPSTWTDFELPILSRSLVEAVVNGREGSRAILGVIAMLAASGPLREEDLVAALTVSAS
jgi:hypothetical protein